MSFVATKTGETVMGNKRVVYGLFTSDSPSGTIATGLGAIDFATVTGAESLVADRGDLAATLPETATAGMWMAFGSF